MRVSSPRPSIWHVIVTLFAMFYLSNFGLSIAGLLRSGDWYYWIMAALASLAWAFLLFDLIKQLSLFLTRSHK